MDSEDGERGRVEGGTGLADAFRILSAAAHERLQSVMFMLGNSPAEDLTHAMSLICLKRRKEALEKLQNLEGNINAKHLVEMILMCGDTLTDFRVDRTELAEENLIDLARIFTVLVEQRLCESVLRESAYRRALEACRDKLGDTPEEALNYTQLIEEAKRVCGPEIDKDSLFVGCVSPLGELSTDPNILYHPVGVQSQPSPLQAVCPSLPSYPTHLEISVPQAEILQEKTTPSVAPSTLMEPPAKTTEPRSTTEPNQVQETITAQDEEAVFYSFVILHSVEDMDLADELKEKLESLGISPGATFSQDFAVPGRHTLTCIEDAIDNSAFTVLLLTKNFNTRLLEVETNAALMNSINNRHKYNTVIPLLPQENRMHREKMPKLLQTLVSLEDNKTFEKRAKKAMSKARIDGQRKVWEKEQMIKEQLRRTEQLRLENKLKMDYIRATKEANALQQERQDLSLDPICISQSSWTPPRSNIHITNARCIMIGNNSQMTVSVDSEEFLRDTDLN